MLEKLVEIVGQSKLPAQVTLSIIFVAVVVSVWIAWSFLNPRKRHEIRHWIIFNPWFYVSVVAAVIIACVIPLETKVPDRDKIVVAEKETPKKPQGITIPTVGKKELPAIDISNVTDDLINKLLELTKGDTYERSYAIDLLRETGTEAIPFLIDALGHKDWHIRDVVVLVLGYHSDNRVVSPILNILENDSSARVRSRAAQALGELKDLKALEPLIRALGEDQDRYVRKYAALSLGHLADVRAVDHLIAALTEDTNQTVRLYSVYALEKIAFSSEEPKAVDFLNTLLNDNNVEIKKAAKDTLGRLSKK